MGQNDPPGGSSVKTSSSQKFGITPGMVGTTIFIIRNNASIWLLRASKEVNFHGIFQTFYKTIINILEKGY